MSDSNKEQSPTDGRQCRVCGEPIYSRASVHPQCEAKSTTEKKARKRAPRKECPKCGKKCHVRTLVCAVCGAMF